MAEEDLIYGKNRHFFGGIEPSNMKAFTAEYRQQDGVNGVAISLTMPDDTVINNQTLCVLGGVVIRRRANHYVEDEFDGEEFANFNVTTSGQTLSYFDSDVEVGVTYYYRAFPFSTQGVYSRSLKNSEAVATVIAGYIPPAMSSFSTSVVFVNNVPNVEISGSIPTNIYDADNQVVDTLERVTIRRSSTSYPISETDGVFISDVLPTYSSSGPDGLPITFTIKDSSVQPGMTYYYTAFPKSRTGLYNYDALNRSTLLVDVGEPPAPPKYFKVKRTAVLEEAAAVIDCDLPDRVESDIPVSVIIKRKIGSYPTDINDGVLVVTFTENDPDHWSGHHRLIDKPLTDGVAYYYRAFSKTQRGAVCNTFTSATDQNITAKKKWVFGFVGKPDGEIIYPEGFAFRGGITETFDNANYTPARISKEELDVTVSPMDYGSWDIEPGTLFMPKPCIIDAFGNVLCYLNPNNYLEKEDCTPVDVLGEYMMEFPHMYITLDHNNISSNGGNQSGSFTITNVRNADLGDWLRHAYPFVKSDGKIMPSDTACKYFYMAIYPSVLHEGSLHSWPANNPAGPSIPNYYTTDSTSTEESLRTLVRTSKTNDKRWDMMSLIDYLYVINLTTLLFKSANSKLDIGHARGKIISSSHPRFNEDKKGLFTANSTPDVKYSGIKLFGIQDLYGGVDNVLVGYTFQKMNRNDLYIGSDGDTKYASDAILLCGNFWENNTYSIQYYIDKFVQDYHSGELLLTKYSQGAYTYFFNFTGNKLAPPASTSLGGGYMSSYIDRQTLGSFNRTGITDTPAFGHTGLLTYYITKANKQIWARFDTHLSNDDVNATLDNRLLLESTLNGSKTTYQGEYINDISNAILNAPFTRTLKLNGPNSDAILKLSDPFFIIHSSSDSAGMFSMITSKSLAPSGNTGVRMIYRDVTVT